MLATGARLVASGNIGCLTQLATHLTAIAGADAPRVVHTIELLDDALRQASRRPSEAS